MHLKEITSQGYYIYEAPVRLWHWITALSIVVLAVTGYFIGRPLPSIQGEATFMFWMGWIRLIHFTTAYIFTVALLFRIYWACVGNEYAREMFLVPFWRRAWRKGVISEILVMLKCKLSMTTSMICPVFCCNNKGVTSRELAYGRGCQGENGTEHSADIR